MTYLFIAPLFIGTSEVLIIAVVILLLIGGKKIPEMMRGLGKGISEFKKGVNDVKAPVEEVSKDLKDDL